uniref:Ribosome biogenesis protein BOP1 homolog n=1 Tax=Leptocylindrus danicus TaxID=163516 RepID=A0A7S2KDQ6_9STRA
MGKKKQLEEDKDSSEEESVSVYDSEDPPSAVESSDDDDDDDEGSSSDEEDDDGFEDQGSSSSEGELYSDVEEESDVEVLDLNYDDAPRAWKPTMTNKRDPTGKAKVKKSTTTTTTAETEEEPNEEEEVMDSAKLEAARSLLMTDDLSSDDEDPDGTQNRIGRVPLHWYDEHDHIGYDVHGSKVVKSISNKNRIDQALEADDAMQNGGNDRYKIYDALNDRDVQLTERQLEIIRRIQSGAYAHPEHEGNMDMIDYFSGVDKEISGLASNRYEPKARFQPSKWEKLQVRRLLHRLKTGKITMDFLNGKVRDMNDLKKDQEPKQGQFLLWTGDEEDELSMRRGPEYIPPPKVAPPGHAESYNPSDEYLPTEEELKQWEEMDPSERPHGHFIPKKFNNLRSVGAYEHSVRERFERCLDLYLCPRKMKRRLNIDPESLVPQLPKASDLRPYPTTKCIEYTCDDDATVVVRCLSVSPSGQYLASGAADGKVRVWEVSTARCLQVWDLNAVLQAHASATGGASGADKKDKDDDDDDNGDDKEAAAKPVKPVVSLEWNPNSDHHCLLAAIGSCAVVLATGTGSADDVEMTEALLSASATPAKIKNASTAKAVQWIPVPQSASGKAKLMSKHAKVSGPVCILRTNFEMASVKWHRRGDYFVTVCPNAGAAAVLIHQLSKANSQQPFKKVKGEAQCACFHPSKPFLFVANKQHIRIYHLVQQTMVKRLLSGCRWISSLDVHPSGDHVIAGSLDRRMIWFDLDLSSTPYKTLKYHEKALRSVKFHPRYPLMASSSDDGNVHIFHSMVYSDLMRNPLIVPVKILRGHSVVNRLGVLATAFHPTQPWIFSAGADGKIILFHDL